MKRRAFTLAEILITLAIIGVVAALTIPSLITNIQNQQYRSSLKKEYSVISQAFAKILSDRNGTFKNLCPGSHPNSGCVKTLFTGYLNVVKDCSASTADGCWHQANKWYYINPNSGCTANAGTIDNCNTKTNSWPGFILSDGSFISFTNWDGTCTTTFEGNANNCGYIMVDVNGFKEPNTVGKDIYAFWITATAIVPLGSNDDFHGYCSSNGGLPWYETGWGCTAQQLLQ